MKTLSALLLLFASLCPGAYAADQQFANIGELKLESDEVIRDCGVGYRTFGTLNREKSNAVLFATALGAVREERGSR